MKKRQRLTRQRDFRRVLSRNRVLAGRTVVAFAAPRDDAQTRVGVSASRKLAGAVARNRAKRRLREAARGLLVGPDSELARRGIGYDVVLIARPAAVDVPFADVLAETRAVADRLLGSGR